MSGLDYGNTRVRARRAQLLRAAGYALLLAADTMDRLLGLLGDTPYRPDVEAAVARYSGGERLDAALRSHLARSLRDVLSFYQDPQVPEVTLLLERWDVRNLRVILRAKAHPAPGFDVDAVTIPAGNLAEADLAELAAQDGVRAVIDLMIAWGLPSPYIARQLVVARGAYEESGDAVVLEDALNRAYASRLADYLAGAGRSEPVVLLQREIDATNIVTALRLFAARQRGELADDEDVDRFLPGGEVGLGALQAAATAASAGDAVGALRAPSRIAGFEAALTEWGDNRDLVRLEQTCASAVFRSAARLVQRTDPLGPGVPVTYVFAKETEVRNLRWIGRGIIHQLSRDDVAAHLVVPP